MEPSVSKEEYWKAHIEECSRSGESQHDYCRRCNLALATFGKTLFFEKNSILGKFAFFLAPSD